MWPCSKYSFQQFNDENTVCACVCVCLVSDELFQYHSLSPAGKSLYCTSTLRVVVVFFVMPSSVCKSTIRSLEPQCLEWILGSPSKWSFLNKSRLIDCAPPRLVPPDGGAQRGLSCQWPHGGSCQSSHSSKQSDQNAAEARCPQPSWNCNWIYLDWTAKAGKFVVFVVPD